MKDDFFVISGSKHYLGSRLELFDKDFKENLKHYCNSVHLYKQEELEGSGVLKGIYPHEGADSGFILTVSVSENKANFETMIGFIEGVGREYSGEIRQIYLWDNDMEAQIGFKLGFGGIKFYDLNFCEQRHSYEPNKSYRAKIYAVAFSARFAQDETIDIKISAQNQKAFGGEIGEIKQLHTGQMRQCVPLEDGDIDEYSLSGKVSSVREIHLQTFDKRAYVCTFDALYENEESFYEFDVVILEEVWNESEPPKVGEFIQVLGYFSGYIVK